MLIIRIEIRRNISVFVEIEKRIPSYQPEGRRKESLILLMDFAESGFPFIEISQSLRECN